MWLFLLAPRCCFGWSRAFVLVGSLLAVVFGLLLPFGFGVLIKIILTLLISLVTS